MTDQRTVDLDAMPVSESEVRVQKGDCKVSIWLPADAADAAVALKALGLVGFDWPEIVKEEQRK